MGHKVTVVAPDHPEGEPLNDGVTLMRFKYFPFRKLQRLAYGCGILPNLRTSWLAKTQIPFFLVAYFLTAIKTARKCDIIYANWNLSGLIGLWCRFLTKIPVVLHIRGSDY